jgi:hypothetical protein
MLLTKAPFPVPLDVVFVAPMTGFAVVAQQTPLAVTAPPPSAVMSPPAIAVVKLIPETVVVVSVAITIGDDTNKISAP